MGLAVGCPYDPAALVEQLKTGPRWAVNHERRHPINALGHASFELQSGQAVLLVTHADVAVLQSDKVDVITRLDRVTGFVQKAASLMSPIAGWAIR